MFRVCRRRRRKSEVSSANAIAARQKEKRCSCQSDNQYIQMRPEPTAIHVRSARAGSSSWQVQTMSLVCRLPSPCRGQDDRRAGCRHQQLRRQDRQRACPSDHSVCPGWVRAFDLLLGSGCQSQRPAGRVCRYRAQPVRTRRGFSPSAGKCLDPWCCFRGRSDCRLAGDMRLAMNSRGDSLEISRPRRPRRCPRPHWRRFRPDSDEERRAANRPMHMIEARPTQITSGTKSKKQ